MAIHVSISQQKNACFYELSWNRSSDSAHYELSYDVYDFEGPSVYGKYLIAE